MSELSAASIAKIEASPVWRTHRMEVFELPEGKVIVKGLRPVRSNWGYGLLNLLARWMRAPAIGAVPMHGGAQALQVELRRIRELMAVGVSVPRVLHSAPDHFVMRYLGSASLTEVLIGRGFAGFPLWQLAAEQLVHVHAKGQYLSQAFARNIIVDASSALPSVLGFIDFEDDPAEAMDLVSAQVRDWLAFLQSTVYYLNAPRPALTTALRHLISMEPELVRQAVLATCRKLVWLRYLPSARRPWGRDTVMIQAAAQAMHDLLIEMKH